MSPEPFQYAVVRVVPRIDREEFVNVGVIVFCRTRHSLTARIRLDEGRLAPFGPGLAIEPLRDALETIGRIADGAADAGPIARLPQSERFHWLVAPSSTVIQTSPVHSGLCEDPEQMLDHLMRTLVLV